MADRPVTGIVFELSLHGQGSAASNDGVIAISPDGTESGVETVYLTGPGSNPVHTVTLEQFMSRVAAIYRSYCLRIPITVTVRDGVSSLPLIIDIAVVI